MQTWLWLAFFASFAVKMPMWPVHTWLPDAHVEAPTAGSVILAGILLKMGGYGFLRFSLPMFPRRHRAIFAPFVFTLSVIAIIYTSLVALVQEDMKKLIAYSSVAHMGFVTMGIFTLTAAGHRGRASSRCCRTASSRARCSCASASSTTACTPARSPPMAGSSTACRSMPSCFMVFTMANVGLPGTSGFVGEFLTLLGAFRVEHLGGVLRHDRRHPVGRLCALALPPGDLRRAREAEPQGDLDLELARDRDPRAAGRADHPLRHLSRARSSTLTAASVEALIIKSRSRRADARADRRR